MSVNYLMCRRFILDQLNPLRSSLMTESYTVVKIQSIMRNIDLILTTVQPSVIKELGNGFNRSKRI